MKSETSRRFSVCLVGVTGQSSLSVSWLLAALLVFFFLSSGLTGCSKPARRSEMLPNVLLKAQGFGAVRVETEVASNVGTDSDPMLAGLAPLKPEDFQYVVETSLVSSRLFESASSSASGSAWRVHASILRISYLPEAVGVTSEWQLFRQGNKRPFYTKRVTEEHRISVMEHPLGNTRLQAMLEGAVKKNIAAVLEGLEGALAKRTDDEPLELESAVRAASRRLLAQLSRSAGSQQARTVTLEPFIDSDTGEVFTVSEYIERLLVDEARAKFPSLTFIAMDSRSIERVDYVVSGILPFEPYGVGGEKLRHLSMSVLDRETGRIAAHSDAWIANADIQFELTPMYRDSPMYLKDKRVEALVLTARATAGSLGDEEYFRSLATSALLVEAGRAYDRGDHLQALGLFAKAAERRDGKVMKTFSGLYQSFFKLRKTKEAGEAFARLVELGMRSGRLGVKFLFNVDATDFFGQPDELEQYQIWLREIAKNVVASKSCVQVVGHASRSGSEEHNLVLSQRRAELIERRMQAEAPGVDKKATAVGKGFSENIIGTGSNDTSDAIDRRVEFKMAECGA